MGDTGKVMLDIATLGTTYVAREQEKDQERYLNQMKDMQQSQIDEMKRQGPAPTLEGPTQSEIDRKRRAALKKMRAGLSETIRTGPGGLSSSSATTLKPTASSGKKTLGS